MKTLARIFQLQSGFVPAENTAGQPTGGSGVQFPAFGKRGGPGPIKLGP
ncbi:hypothetical protein [Deinococcus arenicola]|uniref:Uncharacterized protein n=1 Tax=Deinococcus arenicola TaxID=2994950 RepID=A0ABU4DKM5_9DEIO|nr:hypothetical protein [Deinococcus sp. ZS9-10]MDV6372990.1 hypothetical protein [Deinococcus sp. ZS9-10]